VTFSDESGSLGPYIRLRIQIRNWILIWLRILLFSSVAFEMPSKNNFFLRIFLLIPYYILGTFTSVFIDKLFISHKKQMKSRFFSIFWLLNGRNRIRTNNYVSGSCSLRPNNLQILRIWLRARIRNTGTNIEFRIRSCSHCPFQSRDIIYKIPSYVQVPIVAGTENTSAIFQSAAELEVCNADSRFKSDVISRHENPHGKEHCSL
jgi:hypothetical protein